jgi:hypothetical protein
MCLICNLTERPLLVFVGKQSLNLLRSSLQDADRTHCLVQIQGGYRTSSGQGRT